MLLFVLAPPEGALVARRVRPAVLAPELRDAVAEHPVVEVLAAQVGVARRGPHLQRPEDGS